MKLDDFDKKVLKRILGDYLKKNDQNFNNYSMFYKWIESVKKMEKQT